MIRRPIVTLLVALLLAAGSLAAVGRLRIDTSLASLFEQDDPAAVALERVLNRFKAVEELLVFAQASDAQPQKLRQFAERFEAAVAADPVASELTERILWRADAQMREFFEQVLVPSALFYLDDAALEAAKRRLTLDEMRRQIRRNETLISTPGPAADALAKVILQDPLRLHEFLLERALPHRPFQTHQNTDAFIAPDGRSILIRVRGRRPVSDLEFSKRFTQVVGKIADEANTDKLRVDLSGGYAIAAASEQAIRGDMIATVVWSVICLQLLFVVAFRRPVSSFLLAFVPVAVGVLYGFGAYALLSERLTPMTAVIGGVLAGLSIDYAIEFLSYYHARRAEGATSTDAAISTRRSVLGAIVAAWATSIVGFVAIGSSHVRALREFAMLGSFGLTGAVLAAMFILPALLVLFDRRTRSDETAGRLPVRGMLGMLIRRPRGFAVLAALVMVLAGGLLLLPGPILPLETDLTVMHPRPNPALETQSRIADAFGTSPNTFVIHFSAADDDQLLRLAHQVDNRLRGDALESAGIAGTFGLASLLPNPAVAAARTAAASDAFADRVITDFRTAIGESLFDPQAYEGYEQFLRRLLTADHPPGVDDLRNYPSLAETILPAADEPDKEPAAEAITLVFLNDPTAERAARDAAVTSIRAALADLPGATLTGMSVLSHDTELAVRRELPRLLILAVAAVMLYLALHFRNVSDTVLAILPTLFGIVCVLAFMRMTGQKLNMINLIAFPLLIGIDVDYGIFIVSAGRRRALRGLSDEQTIDRLAPPTAAVLLCAATTFIGFGSLVFTSVPAVQSLGAAVAVGVASCAAATFLLVVPMMVWLNRRAGVT